jgi:F-type H+-transporting ATPase subunit delta
MRAATVARNYAEALLALAERAHDAAGWGAMINDVAGAVRRDRTLRRFLASPKISPRAKKQILGKALDDRVPRIFLRYLEALIDNRRQTLIPEIATAYNALLEEREGRVHANVTVARPIDSDGQGAIARDLSRALGKTVVPHLDVDPAILGGLVVRFGDNVIDGSVRRRLAILRRRLRGSSAGSGSGATAGRA